MIVRFFLAGILAAVLCAAPTDAAQRIELMDGTVLQGEVLAFDGSVYTIRTNTLGTIQVDKSRVRGIQLQGPASGVIPELGDLRSRIETNPEAMKLIMGLQSDPDVQAVLNDPEIMDAVEKGDLQNLLNHPKIQKLLQNPKVQEIGKGLPR
jgi:hypothetical protein